MNDSATVDHAASADPTVNRAAEDGVAGGGATGATVVCVGESMAQFVPEGAGGVRGSKGFACNVAGAESNVAVALARLGVRASWVSRLGSDALGDRVLDVLGAEGVDASRVARDPAAPTGIFLKEISGEARRVRYYRAGSAASRMSADDASRVHSLDPDFIVTSGVTAALSPSCLAMVRALLEPMNAAGDAADGADAPAHTPAPNKRPRTVFDVNFRPVLWRDRGEAAEALAACVRASDIVFVGNDEAQDLWGICDADALREWFPTPELLIVKRGADPVVIWEGGVRHEEPAIPTEVIESVGAGDAFAAGFLYGQTRGWDPVRSARAGHQLASRVLRSRSDTGEPLPERLLAELTRTRPTPTHTNAQQGDTHDA